MRRAMAARKVPTPVAEAIVTVYTTLRNNDEARRLATTLLEDRLIACANVFPVWSLYRWEDTLKDETEVAVLLKTHADRVPALMKRIPEIHPYEVPCIEVFPARDVHDPFAEWVQGETGTVEEASAPGPR